MRLARPVSGLGDATALDRITGRAFRGHETQIAHQLARIAEPRQIAQLGQTATAAIRSMPRTACSAVATSASDHSGTASRIASSRRWTRSSS